MFRRDAALTAPKFWSLTLWFAVCACHRPQPDSKASAAASAGATATASGSTRPARASTSAGANAAASSAAAVSPSPAASAARQPVLLDEAGRRTAKAYLSALVAGRKATVAKDYVHADQHFSKCLELVPKDARALAERGYARLLEGKLAEADADLAAAADGAPSATLLLQILHNRMLVARKRGDDPAAARFEKAKIELKAARRLASGVTCNTATQPSDLKPEQPKTLAEALKLACAAHAKEASIKPEEVTLGTVAIPTASSEADLWQLATDGPARDGGWTLTTNGPDSSTTANHVLISHGGHFYLYPKLSFAMMARCGYSPEAEVKVAGGVAVPWHIEIASTDDGVGYLCAWKDGTQSSCDSREGAEGEPVQSFCFWAASSDDLIVLDPKTFAGRLDINVTAQASDGVTFTTPAALLDFEMQADQATINACGTRRVIPFSE